MVNNMLVWHLPNRTQGFAAKYKFFSKHDIAMVGGSEKARGLNMEDEKELLQNEYETALYAISGKPHWEGYKKGSNQRGWEGNRKLEIEGIVYYPKARDDDHL